MTPRRAPAAVSALLLAAYLALRLLEVQQSPAARVVDDGSIIVAMAARPLFSEGFLAGPRPFAVPLLYKAFQVGTPGLGIVLLQVGVSALAWCLLAWQASRALHTPWLRPVALGILLLFSASRDLLVFNDTTLTESLSVSLLALLGGLWFWLLRGWARHKVVLLLATGFLWAFARDTNAWVVLCAGGIALAAGILVRERRAYAVVGLAFVLFFLVSNAAANRARRWVFPMLNIVGQRILPSAGNTLFFGARGMPLSRELVELRGSWASDPRWASGDTPGIPAFRSWLMLEGKKTYLSWLASQPGMTLATPLILVTTKINYRMFAAPTFAPLLPAAVEGFLYPRLKHTRAVLILLASVLVVALAIRAWYYNRIWRALLLLAVLLYPHAFVVWHGDAMEIARHAHGFRVHYYLTVWLIVLFTLDALLERRSEQRRVIDETPPAK